MGYEIAIYDESDNLIAYMLEDGTIGGSAAEDIIIPESDITIESAEIVPIVGDVKIYYDGTSWTKVAYWGESEEPVFIDFNGVLIIDKELPFSLQFKDSEGIESTLYTVQGKGKFLFHEDGTWEKIGE